MKVIIVAWLLVGGVWYPGELFDGWAPYEVDQTIDECNERVDKFNKRYVDLQFQCVEVNGG